MDERARPTVLRHPDGQVFPFDAGALCLELYLTGGEGRRSRFEILHEPGDFLTWAAGSRLDPAGHGVDVAGLTARPADLARVKRLREAVWELARSVSLGDGLVPEAVATVNEIAAGAAPVPLLDAASGRVLWRQPVSTGQLITAVARDAVTTFAPPRAERIRKCADPTCALVYLDTSRPRTRRWCSMRRCGNRNKIIEYRRRGRDDDGGGDARTG
jgi:predicted RNA-binding Zn ribbon-like protein